MGPNNFCVINDKSLWWAQPYFKRQLQTNGIWDLCVFFSPWKWTNRGLIWCMTCIECPFGSCLYLPFKSLWYWQACISLVCSETALIALRRCCIKFNISGLEGGKNLFFLSEEGNCSFHLRYVSCHPLQDDTSCGASTKLLINIENPLAPGFSVLWEVIAVRGLIRASNVYDLHQISK